MSGIPDLLAARPGVDLQIQRLNVGDYLIDEAVLIERKAAGDFARSLVDGRLFSQACRMIGSGFRPAWIIQGTAREWAGLGVRREALQGALITLMLVFDLPVLRAADAEETANLVVTAGRQLTRLRDPNYLPFRVAKAKRKKPRQLRLLQMLPGVGRGRAQRLLDHFGSVLACLSASADQLEQIEGIGPKVAAAIREVLD